MLRFIVGAFAVAASLALAACGDGDDPAPAATPTPAAATGPITVAAGKPIVIGMSVALSGDQQNIGNDLTVAAEMAIEEFGATIEGHTIALVARDDGCTDPERATDAARILSADNTLAGVVGPMCTIGAQAANPLYERAGIVHIAPAATRIELSSQGDTYFFRTAWRDDAQAALQAQYLHSTLGATSVVLIDDSEPYGVGLADAFEAAYTARGGQVIDRHRIERGSTDFAPLARQVSEVDPPAVLFQGLNPEGALFIRALRETGYTGIFMGPDGLLSLRDFVGTAGVDAEGAVLTGGPVADRAFLERFSARTGRPPTTPFVLQAHDAVTALLRALQTVVVANADGSLTIDRAALAATVREQRFAGLSGSITFDERGDRRGETASELGLRVYQIENSGLVLVE